jgi:hypothetical protein
MAEEAILHDLRKLGLKKHKKYTKTNSKGMLIIPSASVSEPVVVAASVVVAATVVEEPIVIIADVAPILETVSSEITEEKPLKNGFVELPKMEEIKIEEKPKKIWNFQKKKITK